MECRFPLNRDRAVECDAHLDAGRILLCLESLSSFRTFSKAANSVPGLTGGEKCYFGKKHTLGSEIWVSLINVQSLSGPLEVVGPFVSFGLGWVWRVRLLRRIFSCPRVFSLERDSSLGSEGTADGLAEPRRADPCRQ